MPPFPPKALPTVTKSRVNVVSSSVVFKVLPTSYLPVHSIAIGKPPGILLLPGGPVPIPMRRRMGTLSTTAFCRVWMKPG
jgi:hypothetical protein